MPIKLKTSINLEKYQLLEKQSLTERETPHGTKTIKEMESINETLPSWDGGLGEKTAESQSQRAGRRHTKVHCRILNCPML